MQPDVLRNDASRFAGLTFPRYAPLLANVEYPLVAAGLSRGSAPLALALAVVEERCGRLLSLYVDPQARRAGLGTDLLGFLERELTARADLIWTEYTSSLPHRPAFEGVLRRARWEPPQVREVRVSGPLGPVVDLARRWPGLSDVRDARLGITFEPWPTGMRGGDSMGDGIGGGMAALLNEPDFHPALAPALYAARIDASISLAIRRHGRLVGWVLGERLANPTGVTTEGVRINWPSAYVTRSLWHSGVLIRAFVRSLALARTVYGDDATASLYAALPRVMAMVRQRSAGTFVAQTDIKQALKRLR